MIQSKLKIAEVYCLPWFFVITVFTGKSTYVRKSASLERAPLFSQKGRPFEKHHVKGALIWELHKKKSIIYLIVLFSFVNSGVSQQGC